MDLWIRSQDRERLLKVDNIYITENNDKTDDEYGTVMIYEYTDSESQCLLGIYKTKERALEVLEEIQGEIEIPSYNKSGNYQDLDLFVKSKIFNQMTIVYEMPKA